MYFVSLFSRGNFYFFWKIFRYWKKLQKLMFDHRIYCFCEFTCLMSCFERYLQSKFILGKLSNVSIFTTLSYRIVKWSILSLSFFKVDKTEQLMAWPLRHSQLFGQEHCFHCFRRQRIAEMKELQQKAKFGDVREISAIDYVDQVNKAGEGVWVILHLFKSGYLFNESLKLV